MILAIAGAVALSLQLEAGANLMQRGQDDLYYDEQLAHNIQFATPAFGVGLRFDLGGAQLTAGYRDLGHQEINTTLLDDTVYFHCRDVTHNCSKLTPIESWDVHMHLQQEFVQLGYGFKIGGWRLVPTAGVSINTSRIDVNNTLINGYGSHNGVPHAPQHIQGGSQRNVQPFGGVSLQRGSFGLSAFIVNTGPTPVMPSKNDHTNADWYPGTGNTSYLFLATYNFNLFGGK
jgi:hypothetical protein